MMGIKIVATGTRVCLFRAIGVTGVSLVEEHSVEMILEAIERTKADKNKQHF